ncbi:glycoside hydrolase family 5 protein [Amanita thiersii Skay4041]|uniref:glucan 1,3-beta-glucosidase n=1 Tax=Amanita thiersii Skay4041 TaxID=703135 RepID=A0A2A9NU89_9AGAR|nr:glycoside hydrolase family 5 protein [Amanita thiersii Skay4041]
MEDGSKFVYLNDFGGEWAYDPKKPFAEGGKAQSWGKTIGGKEEWVWGGDVARGVNLGGWLVTEPFICPGLYEKYLNNSNGVEIKDEWTLSLAMGSKLAQEMEEHYKTFITERDFAEIAAAGLNWVRIPIGFWAIETMNDEPFLEGVSWKYFLKAIQWGRKYGIRIYLDLHALPGSQNGWNHSGKSGSVNFMNGVMGIANAQRTLTYLRILTQFVSQDQYKDVVGIVGIVNEILWDTIGKDSVQSFYFAAHAAIRGSTGTGAGAGPYIAIHEGFQGVWVSIACYSFLSGADRVVLDQHPVLSWNRLYFHSTWAIATNQSQKVFGVTVGGEFSTAITDCGLWYVLNGIGSTPSNPDCSVWDDWKSYNASTIDGLKQVTLATMDALQNFFFWTWKIGDSTVLGTSSSPLWHYRLGLQQGWIPKDPREAAGHCAAVLSSSQIFDGVYPSTATGGVGAIVWFDDGGANLTQAGAGTIDPAQATSHAFPPSTLSPSFSGTQISLLPTYTPTGTIKTLHAPTFTAAPSADVGDGWNNDADSGLAFVPVKGCQYPDAWNAVTAPLPTSTCTG